MRKKRFSLKHLFTRVNIPNNLTNNKNDKDNHYSSFNKKRIFSTRGKIYNSLRNTKTKNDQLLSDKFNIKYILEECKTNLFNKKHKKRYSTNMTQTPALTENVKNSKQIFANSFLKRHNLLNQKKHKLRLNQDSLSLFTGEKEKCYLNTNCNSKNNICINSNINKTISNVIVDNKIDLAKEIRLQTVNNFNNKYRLKFKTKIPREQNKISNIFSQLKLYKYEEEKKINAIKALTHAKSNSHKIKRKKELNSFYQKDYEKLLSIITKDLDDNKKINATKKCISINTLELVKYS